MQNIRTSLRGLVVVLMERNTMMRKAIRGHLDNNAQLEKLWPHIKGNVGFVFTKGNLAEVLDTLLKSKSEDLRTKFQAEVAKLATVSLAIGYLTIASAPHSIANGLKNLLAIAAATKVEFKEAATIKVFIKDPSKFAAAAAAFAPAAGTEEKEVFKKEESESEEAENMGFGLFV